MSSSASDVPVSAAEGVAAVDRALLVVTVLAHAHEPMALAALARETGLYKSTALRLLASLQRSALVAQRADKRYVLGPLAFLLGRAFEQTYGLKECIGPVLAWLVQQGTESASFHVLHGKTVRMCLFRRDSGHATLDRVRAGDLLPLDRGAPGRVLTTFAQGVAAAAQAPLVIQSSGERDPSCGAIAVPVFGPAGLLMGALSVSGPLERFSAVAVQRMSGLLLQAGARATDKLGGVWPQGGGVCAAPGAEAA